MKITFLGTGTSTGVPETGCTCPVCTSRDPRDSRLRTSVLIETNNNRILLDCGPDFRQQMLREDVRRIDAILLTHGHTDHVAGLDDVRAFNFVDYPTIHRVDIFASAATAQTVLKVYDYAFAQNKYRGVPEIDLHIIDYHTPFEVCGVEVVPVLGKHSRFEVTGYRIGALAYLTDFKEIADDEVEKIKGVEVLVVNALRFTPHDSHFCVDDALRLIERVAPREAYLTHMSHEVGLYDEASSRLPEGVKFAYDGLKIEVKG